MSNIISVWRFDTQLKTSTIVLPDGCRDVIVKTVGNQKPQWFISPLFDRPEQIEISGNSAITGFRLCPGTDINEQSLISYLEKKQLNAIELSDVLNDFAHCDNAIDEALQCLASGVGSVQQASRHLGVSVRTLQRLVLNKTNRSPSYWFQLARVRKAAKSLKAGVNLAQLAETSQFSDQSHMNREFQRWFRLTPLQLLKSPDLLWQLNDTGYG